MQSVPMTDANDMNRADPPAIPAVPPVTTFMPSTLGNTGQCNVMPTISSPSKTVNSSFGPMDYPFDSNLHSVF